MKEGQDTIYFLAGDNAEALKSSPQLEGFRAKGIEVLLMSDSIDAFWPERLDSFEDKKLRSVTQAAEELGKGEDLPDISPLLAAMKTALGDRVSDVRSTGAADRQRRGAGVARFRSGPADAAPDAPGRTGDDAVEADPGG